MESEIDGLKIDEYKPARFTSMHVAILDSVIAESFLLDNERNYSNGRVAIDCSHGRPELEAEKGKTALEDIEVLVKYEELARENLKLKKKVEEIESHLEKIREREDGNAYQTKGKHQESDKIKSNVMYPLTYSEKGRGV